MSALKKMSKDELIEAYNSKESVTSAINNLTSKLEAMELRNAELEKANARLEARLTDTEKQLANTSQYSRRRLLEITTSAATLRDGPNIKTEVARCLSMTGVQVQPADLDICHTVGKEKKRVILEMPSRTLRYELLSARKKLKGKTDPAHGNLFINESMCPQYQKLDYACRRLKKDGKINATWFWNGRLFYKLT